MPTINKSNSDSTEVIIQALLKTQNILQLSDMEIDEILGIDCSTVFRAKQQESLLKNTEKLWEPALLLIRLLRALSGLVGDDDQTLQYWLRAENSALDSRPIDLIKSTEGLVKTVTYLETMKELSDASISPI